MTYNDEQMKNAVKGTDDYHTFMTQITVTKLMQQAGYKPQNTGEIEKIYPNWINWQSRKMNMGIGVLWIFYAVENGHYTTHEAKLIWRYGQALKFPRVFCKNNPEISKNAVLMEAIKYIIKNPHIMTDGEGDVIYSANDEFGIRYIHEGIFQQPYEIYPNSFGGIDIQHKKYKEIVRLIDSIILWLYTGSQYLETKDRKELFKFMEW